MIGFGSNNNFNGNSQIVRPNGAAVNGPSRPNGGNDVINLSKGQKINLSKQAPGLTKIMFGLGWDCQKYSGQYDFDLDASCFLIDGSGRTKPDGFIFYNNLIGPNKCVQHMGDERRGGTENADDEQIYVDLSLVPDNIEKIAITVTIDQARERHQFFSMVENAYCRLIDTETDKEQFRFDLGEDFSSETGVVVCELYKHAGDWKLNAVGRGFDGGLMALCNNYGLDAEYK